MKKKLAIMMAAVLSALSFTGCAVVRTVGNGLTNIDYDFADKYHIGGGTVTDKVDTIDINWVSGKINLKTSDEDQIKIEEVSDSSNEDFKIRYLVVDGTLRIQFSKSGKWNFNNIKKELTITIPKNLMLDKFDLSMVSSKCTLDGLNADTLNVDGVSGDVTITNSSFDRAEFDTVSGTIDFTGDIKNKVRIDSVSGDARLNLPEGTGFKAKISAVSGSFDSNFECTGEKKEFKSGDGALDISMNAVSGSLKVMKAH